MENFWGCNKVFIPCHTPSSLELVAVVLSATTDVENASELHSFTRVNIMTVFAECELVSRTVRVWCHLPLVAVTCRAFFRLHSVSLNNYELSAFAHLNDCHRVSVNSVADVCAVSDYWLRSFYGIHFVPFRGTRLQMKQYRTRYQIYKMKRTGEQVFGLYG